MQSEKYCVGNGTTEKNEDRANVDRAHTEMDIMIGRIALPWISLLRINKDFLAGKAAGDLSRQHIAD